MTEDEHNLVGLKIWLKDHDWVEDEQKAIKRAGRKKPSQAALFHSMREAYSSQNAPVNQSPDSGKHPAAPEAKNSQPSYSEEFSGWHKILEAILSSGDREAISAVQQNLRVFFRGIGDPDEILSHGKASRKAAPTKNIAERATKPPGIKKPHRQPGAHLPAKA